MPVVLLSYISIFFPFCPHYFHSVGVISIFRAKLPSVFHPQNFSSGMEVLKNEERRVLHFGDEDPILLYNLSLMSGSDRSITS